MTKSILITGCSSGIGYASATALKKRGWRVFATARQPHDVAKLNAEGFESVLLDVRHDASIHAAIQFVLERTGGTLDALFNNAGFMQAGALEDLTRDMIREQFETNTFGPIELTKAIIPLMRKQGHGRIVQNSSILGVIAMPFYGAYNGSKFALDGMTSTLRQELHGTGIHVSLINPGPITSELRQTALRQYEKTIKDRNSYFSDYYKKMEKHYFNKKPGKATLAQDPKAVIKQLIHALENPRPKARYYTGWPAKLMAFLRRALPDHWLDKIILTIR